MARLGGFQKLKSKFKKNSGKTNFLESLPTNSLGSSDIAERCKFNFSYYDGAQDPSSEFSDLTKEFLCEVLQKVKSFTRFKLSHWLHERAGSGGLKVFSIYGKFPAKSDFVHPKSVPHDVSWARFRLDNMTRLIGFVISQEKLRAEDFSEEFPYDLNTFYVVFIDRDHRFYKTEQK